MLVKPRRRRAGQEERCEDFEMDNALFQEHFYKADIIKVT